VGVGGACDGTGVCTKRRRKAHVCTMVSEGKYGDSKLIDKNPEKSTMELWTLVGRGRPKVEHWVKKGGSKISEEKTGANWERERDG